ncbi:MAG: hypothetical protein WAZ99_05890 [Rectinemataceae bacterium]
MNTVPRLRRAFIVFMCLTGFAFLPGAVSAEAPVFALDFEAGLDWRLSTASELVEQTPIKNGIDLQREYFDRMPIARLEMEYGAPQGLSVAIEATIRREWDGDWFKTDNLFSSVAGNPVAIENLFLTRGIAEWNSPGIHIGFGRDQFDYSRGLEGSLLPSARLSYLDAFQFDGTLGRTEFNLLIASIPARESWDGYDVDPNAILYTDLDPAGYEPYGFEGDQNPTTVLYAMHRIGWDLGDFSLGVSEQVMMARRNNRFYLTDFFPIVSWHQTGVYQTNNSMVFDAAWAPVPGLRVMAQAGFDDINGNSIGIGDTGAPTIDAYVAGLSWETRFFGGAAGAGVGANASPRAADFSLYAEAGYTHWLWGNYSGTSNWPKDENPLMRFQYRLTADRGGLLLPLTSPYGPGAIWAELRTRLSDPKGRLSAGFEFLFLAKNPEANLIDTGYTAADEAATTPYVLFLEAGLPLRAEWSGFEAGLRPALVWREGKVSYKAVITAAWRFTSK